MKEAYYDVIKQYIEDNPDITDMALADIIEQDGEIDKTHRTIRWYIGLIKNDKVDETGAPIKKSPVVDNTKATAKAIAAAAVKASKPVKKEVEEEEPEDETVYKIKYSDETYEMDVDLVDRVFCAYSKKGLNYNKPQIMEVLDITSEQFNGLVARLELSKESDPVGPRSAALPESDKYNRIISISEEIMSLFKESDNGTVEALIREYKRKIIELANSGARMEEIYQEIVEKLPEVKVSRYNYSIEMTSGSTLFVVIGDMHMGLETDNFNLEKAREALATMSFNINAQVKAKGYKNVTLIFLGDIIHTVSGVNHANMWKDIEPGLWGASAMIKPFELLTEFISNTLNVDKIYGVGGNHDRLADRKDLEPSDEGGKLIFYMIQNTFKDIEVEWDPDKVMFTESKLTFIVLHGDQGQDKRPGQEIAWNLGKANTYNLILVGHTHSRQIAKNDDGIGYRKMVCPAFCPTDSYAERLGYNSLPGFMTIVEDFAGYPIVTDYPLHYKY